MGDRREFIKKVLLAGTSAFVLPFSLGSCAREGLFGTIKDARVAVVGGGLAGLHAASILLKYPELDVTLFEASQEVGGRVRSEEVDRVVDVSDRFARSLELGADFIYGRDSVLYEAARSFSTVVRRRAEQKSYFIRGNVRTQADLVGSNDSDHFTYNELIKRLLSEPKTNISISDYLFDREEAATPVGGTEKELEEVATSHRVQRMLLDHLLSLRYGLTTQEMTIEDFSVRNGEKLRTEERHYTVKGSVLSRMLAFQYRHVHNRLNTNAEVRGVDYSNPAKISLQIKDRPPEDFDRVILTVPPPALKDHIQFAPALPREKSEALSAIGMSPCLKVFLKFNSKFWENHLDAAIPGPISRVIAHPEENILIAYAYGARAVSYESSTPRDIRDDCLNGLDSYFDGKATSAFEQERVFFWKENSLDAPHGHGAFSYLSPGSGRHARHFLSYPVANRLFFAGEATHTLGKAGTMHGAVETGYRAAYELLKSLEVS